MNLTCIEERGPEDVHLYIRRDLHEIKDPLRTWAVNERRSTETHVCLLFASRRAANICRRLFNRSGSM